MFPTALFLLASFLWRAICGDIHQQIAKLRYYHSPPNIIISWGLKSMQSLGMIKWNWGKNNSQQIGTAKLTTDPVTSPLDWLPGSRGTRLSLSFWRFEVVVWWCGKIRPIRISFPQDGIWFWFRDMAVLAGSCFEKMFNDYETSCHVLQVSVSVAFDEFQKNMFGFCYSESAVRFGQQ